LWTASDNRAALAWSTKGSATSIAARTYLLRLNAMHQRRHRYAYTQHHIAGKANVMADDASRLWHLDDAQPTTVSLLLSQSAGISLATASVTTRHQLGADWSAVQTATRSRGVSRQRARVSHNSWSLWFLFCANLQVDPFALPTDPTPILQVFAQRLRAGTLTPGRRPARARSVQESLRAVGQTYAGMGTYGTIDSPLTSVWRRYTVPGRRPTRPHRESSPPCPWRCRLTLCPWLASSTP
jgi:hypothetical protein